MPLAHRSREATGIQELTPCAINHLCGSCFLIGLRLRLRLLSCFGALGLGTWASPPGIAQRVEQAVLSGTVTDSTGAVIRGATAHLLVSDRGTKPSVTDQLSDIAGRFSFVLPAGTYIVEVQANGFASFCSKPLVLKGTARLQVPVRMVVAGLDQEISVLSDEASGASDPNGAGVFEGEALDVLSNDSLTLQQQLTALAGGLGTPHFTIDGFSGGRLPAKASIRSIRINRNLFSAAFSEFRAGRVDLSTKPGMEKLHGELDLSGTDQLLDARNPYTIAQPPFYDFEQEGNLNGPLSRKSSFFVSDSIEQLANNAVVNASDPLAPGALISTAVAAPQRAQTYTLRVDQQIGQRNFAYAREEWTQTHIVNSGIAPLVLPQAAFTSNELTNTLQVSDTQMIGSRGVNEARFQYLRSRLRQDPNSTLPSVIVESAFQSGGSPAQVLRDNRDGYEVQELLELEHGRHAMRAGFRFRALRDSNQSSAGFNGQYIFADVASYQAGQAAQFSLSTGQRSAVLRNDDVGIFAEDDWKVTPNLTISYGFRFESESAIPDHSDPAPRVGFAWAVRPGKRKVPILTLRGGYGIFYDRFPATQLLRAVRENGTRQIAYFALNTGFNPNGPPPGVALSSTEPTIYQVDPRLRSSYLQAGSLSAARSLGRYGSVTGTFQYAHDTHDFLTRNANAPLPGTFRPGDPTSGTRPLGTLANVYQFASVGNGNLERFYLNYRLQLSKRLIGFGIFDADRNYADADDIDEFVSNAYDIRQDYGRAGIDQARAFTGGFEWTLPYAVEITPFLSVHSGAPFDITTGTDLNGDTVYRDRPALSTDSSRSSVVQTAFGNFDVVPVPGRAVLPRNYGTAPGYVWLQLHVSKDFRVGPRPKVRASATAEGSAPGPDRPWTLRFGVEVHNLTNHNNPGLPVGVLSAEPCGATNAAAYGCAPGSLAPSQYFGHSLSLAKDFSSATASNRTILLQSSFSF